MKNVCTDWQGTIHSPPPGARPSRLSRPLFREAAVSAISRDAARTVPRVPLTARILRFGSGGGDEANSLRRFSAIKVVTLIPSPQERLVVSGSDRVYGPLAPVVAGPDGSVGAAELRAPPPIPNV